jgi:hypothetical protein
MEVASRKMRHSVDCGCGTIKKQAQVAASRICGSRALKSRILRIVLAKA